MPTLTTTPIALPQDKELETSDQFELDIRISMVKLPMPTLNNTQIGVTCNTCIDSCGCATGACSYENNCTGTALTCNHPYC